MSVFPSRTLVVAALLTAVSPAAAQSNIGDWFNPRFGQLRIAGDYAVKHWCQQGIDQTDTSMHITSHDAQFSVPIFQNQRQELSARARVGVWDIEGGAMLPDKGIEFPDDLWDVAFGATYRWKLENDWIAGIDGEIGSASDKPFHSEDEWLIRGTGWLMVPTEGRDAWLFFLSYSNTRDFLPHAPLPGAAYSWHVNDKLHWLVGFPYTRLSWEPIDRLELEASYFFPRTIHARIGYRVLENVKVYGGYDWDYEQWFRAGRSDYEDGIFYYEQRVSTGVRWEITDSIYVDASGGYAFDRMFFEGEDYDDRGTDRINIGDGLFVGVKAGIRF